VRATLRRPGRPFADLPPAVFEPDYTPVASRLASLAEADPGREVCGFVTVDPGGILGLVPVRNVAGEGDGVPGIAGDARRAYLAEPAAQLALSRRLRVEGGRIAAVYHSHVDGAAVLSDVDVEQALCDGVPLLPGVDQVVVGTRTGKVTEIRVFRWEEGRFRCGAVLRAG